MQDVLEVTVEWCGTVIDVQHLGADEHFTLDSTTPYGGLDDLLPPEGLQLARVTPDGIHVLIPQGIQGAHLGEGLTALPADAAQALMLAVGTRARCTIGPLTIYFARVAPAVHPGRRTMLDLLSNVKTFGAAAALHAVIMLVAIAMPPTKQALSIDRFMGDDRYVDVLMVPEDQLIVLLTPATKDIQTGEETGQDNTDAPTEVVDAPKPSPVHTPRAPRTPEEIQAVATRAAGAITDALDGDLFGAGDPLGAAGNAAVAGLNGLAQGDGHGMGGANPFGGVGVLDGMFGGPKGSIAAAGVKTGCKGCRDVKTAYDRKHTKRARGPKVIPLPPTVADGLSRAEVMRTIRTKKNQYRTCYEAALQSRRGLEGTIRMTFIVGSNGSVISAKASANTMGVPDVANCIARRMRTWTFPRPRGGGIVKVTYPFLFRAPE